mmetsp:Transcript_24071/g.71967  ORF Transcript_24071/g.71967 Transcript_24071/m.71967 type:complete len:220 (+) Transcript_24071:234-893(+)
MCAQHWGLLARMKTNGFAMYSSKVLFSLHKSLYLSWTSGLHLEKKAGNSAISEGLILTASMRYISFGEVSPSGGDPSMSTSALGARGVASAGRLEQCATATKFRSEVCTWTGTHHTIRRTRKAQTSSSHGSGRMSERAKPPRIRVAVPKMRRSQTARRRLLVMPPCLKRHANQERATSVASGGLIKPLCTFRRMKQLENSGVKRPQKNAELAKATAMSP